jgi:GLPGLI family protein
MKILNFLFIGFVLSLNCLNSQKLNGSITYIGETKEKLKQDIKKGDINKLLESMQNLKTEFILDINNNQSIYSIKNNIEPEDISGKMAQVWYGSTDRFYIDLGTKEHVLERKAYGDIYLLPVDKSEWKLSTENKKIGKYLCYKATTEYESKSGEKISKKYVIAWYTNEINLSFGPRGYFGLPGLILELQDDKLLFKASEINLNLKKEIKIQKPSKGKSISRAEFESLSNLYKRG